MDGKPEISAVLADSDTIPANHDGEGIKESFGRFSSAKFSALVVLFGPSPHLLRNMRTANCELRTLGA